MFKSVHYSITWPHVYEDALIRLHVEQTLHDSEILGVVLKNLTLPLIEIAVRHDLGHDTRAFIHGDVFDLLVGLIERDASGVADQIVDWLSF